MKTIDYKDLLRYAALSGGLRGVTFEDVVIVNIPRCFGITTMEQLQAQKDKGFFGIPVNKCTFNRCDFKLEENDPKLIPYEESTG